jgi:DivIVA domain-containing protein
MPMMPADVANVAFSRPPLGTRGYDEDQVDALLDLVEAELAQLIQENTDLRNRVESLDQQQLAAPVDTGGDLHRLESLGPPSPSAVAGADRAGW